MRSAKLIVVFGALLALSTIGFGQERSARDLAIDAYRAGNHAETIKLLENLGSDLDYSASLYLAAAYVHSGQDKNAGGVLDKLSTYKRAASFGYDSKVNILNKPKPMFGERARRSVRSGSIRVLIEYRSDGTLGFVFPFAISSDTLIDGAVTAGRQVTFEPAILAGKPVTAIGMLEFHYNRY